MQDMIILGLCLALNLCIINIFRSCLTEHCFHDPHVRIENVLIFQPCTLPHNCYVLHASSVTFRKGCKMLCKKEITNLNPRIKSHTNMNVFVMQGYVEIGPEVLHACTTSNSIRGGEVNIQEPACLIPPSKLHPIFNHFRSSSESNFLISF